MAVLVWIKDHYGEIFALIFSMLGVAEVIVRLTPTKKDDGAVQRIGEVIKNIMDFLKIPNVKK